MPSRPYIPKPIPPKKDK